MLPFVQMVLQHLVSFKAEADIFQVCACFQYQPVNHMKLAAPRILIAVIAS